MPIFRNRSFWINRFRALAANGPSVVWDFPRRPSALVAKGQWRIRFMPSYIRFPFSSLIATPLGQFKIEVSPLEHYCRGLRAPYRSKTIIVRIPRTLSKMATAESRTFSPILFVRQRRVFCGRTTSSAIHRFYRRCAIYLAHYRLPGWN